MPKKIIGFGVGLTLSAALLVPFSAFASLSSGQVQAVITLLQSFGVDQATVNNVSAALTGSAATSVSQASCVTLSYNLYAGQTDASTNGQVTQLQTYLGISPATGYFGPLTEQAVQNWQSARGIVTSGSPDTTGFGFVGPQTRAAMSCGGNTLAATAPSGNTYTPTLSFGGTTVTPNTALSGGGIQAAFDQSSLKNTGSNPLITGIAQGVSQVRINIYGHQSITAPVVSGAWSAQVSESLPYGVYSVQIVNAATGAVLASGALQVSGTTGTQVAQNTPANIVPPSTGPGVVVAGQNTSATAPKATMDSSSLAAGGAGFNPISGTATNTKSLLVYMLLPSYAGGRDFASISSAPTGYEKSVLVPNPNPVPVQSWNNMWFARFSAAGPRGSVVAVFDANTHALLVYGYVGGGVGSIGSSGGENGGGETAGGNGAPGGDTSGPSGPSGDQAQNGGSSDSVNF